MADPTHLDRTPQAPAGRWTDDYAREVAAMDCRRNRSGIVVEPLYAPHGEDAPVQLGYPGQPPFTRGIHASMYRGRPWSQRLVVGYGLPEHYNARMRMLYESGAHGLYLAPCNSHMRGYDADEVPPELLGTCGTLINTVADLDIALDGLPYASESLSLGDTAPFTLSAMLLVLARQRGIAWAGLRGTTNQSDYLSHCAALHMFFRLSLPGARRMLLDHVEFMLVNVPHWNALSVVGQHMQQAGATPAQAMAFALSSAIQHADDLVARGLDPDRFLPRLSFFFDVSISFFEEIAKFRAGRRIWARVARQRYRARDPRSMQLRFHTQTAGTDLTRQQPLNNIARVAVQAMAAILGGTQSLHTDAWDEALSAPGEAAARVAISTQNILRDEALLDQVIDPLGGAYFVERHTDEMEAAIVEVMRDVEQAGGMYAAVGDGYVQRIIGEAALAWQNELDAGSRQQVGVNCFTADEDAPVAVAAAPRVCDDDVACHLERLRVWRRNRDGAALQRALDALVAAFDNDDNAYARVVDAVAAGATHGEICACVRRAVGPGVPVATI